MFAICRWSPLIGFGLIIMNSSVVAGDQGKCGTSVTVSHGDTLSILARRCNVTLSALIEANSQLNDPDILTIGTTLSLPRRPQDRNWIQPATPATANWLVIDPPVLTPGAQVAITATNLPAGAFVWIKGGTSRLPQHHLILQGTHVNIRGELHMILRLPKWLRAGKDGFILSVEVPRRSITLSSHALAVHSASSPITLH